MKQIMLNILKKTSEYFAESSIGNTSTGWLHQPSLSRELKKKIKVNMNTK